MATDPVQFAMANANRNRVELDAMHQRQRQIGQDVMQNANTFRSWSDRAASLQESQRQFDITQNLRERQAALQQERSAAELAAIKTNQELQSMALDAQKLALEEKPFQDAAFGKLLQTVGTASTYDQLNEAQKAISSDQNVLKYVPKPMIEGMIQKQRLAIGQSDQAILSMKVKESELAQQNNYLSLAAKYNGPGLEAFVDTEGNFDRSAFNQAYASLTEKESQAKAAQEIAIDVAKREALTKSQIAINKAKFEAKDAAGNPLSKSAAITAAARYRGLAANAFGERAAELNEQANFLEEYATRVGDSSAPAPAKPAVVPDRRAWFNTEVPKG